MARSPTCLRLRLAVALVALLACATSSRTLAQPTIAQASAAEQKVARAAFAEGMQAFERADYAAALERFEVADHAVSSPNVKLMRARCLAMLARATEAYAMYGATLREAASWDDGRYQASADAAAQEQSALGQKLALPGSNASSSAAAEVASAPPSASAPPASARTQVASPELAASLAPLHAPAGRLDAADGGIPTLPLVLGVAGGAGLVSFAAFGALSQAQWGKLEGACSADRRCDPSLARSATRGRTYQTIANLSLGVATALIATSVTLFVLHAGDDTAELAITPTGLRVRGAL